MGQRWSILKIGYQAESEYEDEEEEEAEAGRYSVTLAHLHQSQATTEASSSVPALDKRDLCCICPTDVEIDDAMAVAFLDRLLRFKVLLNNNLSSLQSGEAIEKRSTIDASATPNRSGVGRIRPRKLARPQKLDMLHGQNAKRNLGAATKAPELRLNEMKEDEVKVKGKRKLSHFTDSPGSQMMAQLDIKRKRSMQLVLDFPATNANLKAPTLLLAPRRGVGGEGVLDLGTGEAMVGRCVRKMIGGECHYRKGCVTAYNSVHCRYQVTYDDGTKEELEWLDLEPCLMDAKEMAHLKPRYKTVEELVYRKHNYVDIVHTDLVIPDF